MTRWQRTGAKCIKGGFPASVSAIIKSQSSESPWPNMTVIFIKKEGFKSPQPEMVAGSIGEEPQVELHSARSTGIIWRHEVYKI